MLVARARARPDRCGSPAPARAGCCCRPRRHGHPAPRAPAACAWRATGSSGSGTVDMKGGVVLALGVLRALAARPGEFEQAALLLVCDEEWRTAPFAHVDALRGLRRLPVLRGRPADARPARTPSSCRRKAAGTLRVRAHGAPGALGKRARPWRQRAARARAGRAARRRAARARRRAPPDRGADGRALGRRLQRRPRRGRADQRPARRRPPRVRRRARQHPRRARRRAHGNRDAARLAGHGLARLHGRPAGSARARRSGAGWSPPAAAAPATPATSPPSIPITVDGLGPRGGGAHAPHEYILRDSLRSRAEVAAAMVHAWLRG